MTLAFQAGVLNIGGFLACRSFVSHVTGFATLFGLELHRVHYQAALGMLSVPVFFLLGVMISGFLVDLRLQMQKKPQHHIVFGVLFALLLFVVIGGYNDFFGTFGNAYHPANDLVLLAVLCLTCGLQNGTVTLVSRSVVRITHLTGVTTDLGIGLVRVLGKRFLSSPHPDELRANFVRLAVIGSFIAGSVVGVPLFDRWEFHGFMLPAAISGVLFCATFYVQIAPRSSIESKSP